jgi:hypothetical protein
MDGVAAILGTNPCKTSCIYLFDTAMKSSIESEDAVYKFGYTNDLLRRFSEHRCTYGDGLTLECHVPVPEAFLQDAEGEVRSFFEKADWRLATSTFNSSELVSFPTRYKSIVREFYRYIGEKYVRDYDALVAQNNLLIRLLKLD